VVDIAVAVALTLVAVLTAYMGLHMSLHPSESVRTGRRYKAGFIICGVVTVFLVWWQAKRNNDSQKETDRALKAVMESVVSIQQVINGKSPEQRFLPESKIESMVEALMLTRGYRVFLLQGGSVEAEGFGAQLRLTFIAGQWEVAGLGKAYPPRDPKEPILIQGDSISDPGVLAVKAALTIAGFKTTVKEDKRGPQKSIMLYF